MGVLAVTGNHRVQTGTSCGAGTRRIAGLARPLLLLWLVINLLCSMSRMQPRLSLLGEVERKMCPMLPYPDSVAFTVPHRQRSAANGDTLLQWATHYHKRATIVSGLPCPWLSRV